jgi:hypothetical protein
MITKRHHDRRRLDRVVGADKINPRYWPPDSTAIDPTTGVNEPVSTHDSDSIWCGRALLRCAVGPVVVRLCAS